MRGGDLAALAKPRPLAHRDAKAAESVLQQAMVLELTYEELSYKEIVEARQTHSTLSCRGYGGRAQTVFEQGWEEQSW